MLKPLLNRLRAERGTLIWAPLSIFSRLVPLSAIPLMLEYSSANEADRYALIIANSTLLSIVINFGQVLNMQRRFSSLGLESIVSQGIITALTISSVLLALGILSFRDDYLVVTSMMVSIAVALSAQYNSILRCSRNFRIASFAEITRTILFSISIPVAIKWHVLDLERMVAITVIYYVIPYVFMVPSRSIAFTELRSALPAVWRDKDRLFLWTAAAFLSAGAWVSIRYFVSIFGDDGDLARFSAIASVCSAGALLTDLVYVRMSRDIMEATERRDRNGLALQLRRMAFGAMAGFGGLVIVSGLYAMRIVDGDRLAVGIAVALSAGYLGRFFYVFGQTMLAAMHSASFDFLGGIAMMIVAAISCVLLIPPFGLFGAALAFLATSLTLLLSIAYGVSTKWRQRC